MFCRISAERTQGGEMRYSPFRLTPYQLTIKDSDVAEPQPCCLLIAERVHSGYEGLFHHTLYDLKMPRHDLYNIPDFSETIFHGDYPNKNNSI